nr:hypothetical protein [Tanacetum cinerariifolium]
MNNSNSNSIKMTFNPNTTTHVDTTLTPTDIPTVSPIVPPSPDYTLASPDYSPASNTESVPSNDPSSDHIPPLPATSPFLSPTNDSLNSGTPDTPPSPTHGTPFTEITLSTQRSPVASGALLYMMTVRKRVGPLPTHRLAVRHSVDYSSLDLFTSDDSLETSSDSSSDDLSDSSSGHSSSDHSSPALPLTRAALLPSPKRIRSSDFATDFEDCSYKSSESSVPKETSLRDDVVVRNARVVVDTVARKEVETSVRGPFEVRVEKVTHLVMPDDIPEPTQEERAMEGTYETLGALRRELRVRRKMRQIQRSQFYDHMRIARLEACARRHLGYHP